MSGKTEDIPENEPGKMCVDCGQLTWDVYYCDMCGAPTHNQVVECPTHSYYRECYYRRHKELRSWHLGWCLSCSIGDS